MKSNDRFKSIYKQGKMSIIEILVDRKTGVNYLWKAEGYAGGICPLLDRDGTPVISAVESYDDEQ